MNIEYNEATVLARIEPQGDRLTLDDLHKYVWSLFSTTADDKKIEKRPFIFRSEPFDERRWLLTIRSDRSFKGSRERRIAVEQGDYATIDLASLPLHRFGPDSRKEGTLPSEEWTAYSQRLFERSGLALAEMPDWAHLITLRQFNHKRFTVPLITARCTARIDDVSAFARAYLDGIGRRRGYGCGLLQLATVSALRDEAA
ncbi:type I-E CRISPR-associated protein Cas6/Cse3/CasE [Endozoicomonas sp. G2_2]|uniref:type I-E CRISPR-associated protein Cas6/Cse3/CasE n=1 Tax=Endozoicomonas sp. G2_2 TaxID=2821092 RepID=UPI001ADCD1F5|nr:type I-E CRISPR-associated protein Cas6/Cse3/CasE [Endozoicomonas sp. G2_2]MBO9471051.1 type I-E CRISPR-associated protein Cas6/Cse3/CasE [Endozoicomonas sp. G2_2]